MDRKVPFIMLKLLFYIYRNQKCYVKWNSKKSSLFSIHNGVRQGAILSPCLFCVYLDSLLGNLRKSGLGCHIGNLYFGALGYADDVILLSPSRKALQQMLDICQEFADTHSMQFSTDPDPIKSKTKCMHFTKIKNVSVPKLSLNGELLPWVEKAKHLGNSLTVKLAKNAIWMDTSGDLLQKRAIFFHKVHELKQAYGFYSPNVVCELIRTFGTSLYGSPLWNLKSEEHLKLNRSWNTTVKMVFNLPFETHKRFVESLTQVPHLQSTLHGRSIGFLNGLHQSVKPEIKLLFSMCKNDNLSNTGQNINFLLKTYELSNLQELVSEKHSIKKRRVFPMEEGEEWKILLIEELCLTKLGYLDNGLELEVIEDILYSVCTE